MSFCCMSDSPELTRMVGRHLVQALPEGAVVALVGELGVGKTALVQGAASGLDARVPYGDHDEGAVSPSFVLMREYEGRDGRRIVHVDAHRMSGAAELTDIGGDDFLGCDGVTFVEWADRVERALPRPYLLVRMFHIGPTRRRIELDGVGAGSEPLVAAASRAATAAGCEVGNQ